MFKYMTIKTKLNLSSGGFSALVMVAFIYILVTINATSGIINLQQSLVKEQNVAVKHQIAQLKIQKDELAKKALITSVNKNFRDLRIWLLDLSVSWLNEAEDNAQSAQDALIADLDKLTIHNANLSQTIRDKSNLFYELMLEAVDTYVDGNRVKGNALIAESRMLAEQVSQLILNYNLEIEAHLNKANQQVSDASKSVANAADKVNSASDSIAAENASMWNITVVILVLSTLLSISFSIVLRREICAPIERLRTTVEAIQENSDLTQRFEVVSMDEIGITGSSFNTMMERFSDIITQVKHDCYEMDKATNYLVELMKEAQSGVISQEKATDQVAAAIHQMATTVQEVASHTETASHSTEKTKDTAREGRIVVQQSVKATQGLAKLFNDTHESISQVEKFSNDIGSVLDVIRGVSEQTNLLALNAAIEAARAGEAGRGFAVVADEVRTLAKRTQESTQEIDNMISSLQTGTHHAVSLMGEGNTEVQSVAKQAENAANSLHLIESQVGEINDLNTMIATSAEEQSVVAEEINRNVIDISDSSSITTEAVKATVKSSQDLLALSHRLEELVSQFKVN